ncbi:MAG: hypothetical protein JXA52_05900 [Planctomycetes bacterium]|nr:hypothetical protein [Planctomycetota bacterium]
MRYSTAEFLAAFAKHPDLQVLRIVKQSPLGNYETIVSGAVFNCSADKQYVLDNIRDRATHIEVEDDPGMLRQLFPQLDEVTRDSDINLPPDEFFLMEDVYHLPDTGSWNEGLEVDAKQLNSQPQVLIHMRASLHEGTLITNTVINGLRRRISYLRREDKYIRSRDASFRVRPCTRTIFVVVDNAEARETVLSIYQPTPLYKLDFYILEEAGINLEELAQDKLEHVGLIPFLAKNPSPPDAVLFESHRQELEQRTHALVEKRSTNTCIQSKLDWFPTACLPGDLSPENLDATVRQALAEKEEKLQAKQSAEEIVEFEEVVTDNNNSSNGEETNEVGFDLNTKVLTVLYHAICLFLNFPKEHIRSKLEQHKHNASKAAMKFVIEKGLKTVHSAEILDHMTAEDRDQAVAVYIKKYSERIRRIRESIFFETLLMDAQALAMKAYLQKEGLEGKTRLVMEKTRLAAEITEELKETYSSLQEEGLSDHEFLSLYNRDYNKSLKFRLTNFMAQSVGIVPQPTVSV